MKRTVKQRQTSIIIGEGPTEIFYFNSLKDDYKETFQNISPTFPKHTSITELEKQIKHSIELGYDHIYCIIDMDNKHKDKEKADYEKIKNTYHNKIKKCRCTGTQSEILFFETERCTELFFYYYFAYTTKRFKDSDAVSKELNKICNYDKKIDFFKNHPLHKYFESKGGNLKDAISNSLKSIRDKDKNQRDYTYSELGQLFEKLGIK